MKVARIASLALVCAVAASCATSKSLTLLQDVVPGETFAVPEAPEISVRPGDKLKITVSSSNSQLAMPFNMVGGTFSMDAGGNISGSTGDYSYLVDDKGEIDFPILGKVHVAEQNLSQIKQTIADELIKRDLLRDPIVDIDFDNFKVTMIGEVADKGNITIEGNKINLLQAIAQAGDFTVSANLKDVIVIRTVTGARQVYSVNMYSKDLYQSPAFYLQQNDVVYVKPRGSKVDSASDLAFRVTQLGLSIMTAVSSVMWWLNR